METQQKQKKPFYKKWWFWAIPILIFAIAVYGNDEDNSNVDKEESKQVIAELPTNTPKEKTVEPKQEASNVDSDVPKEYKSALNKAETYATIMNMSKSAIFEQLTSEFGEKFSEEAAQYAMENIEFNWKANALKKAESYSDTMSMSKQGIYDQLISEHGEKFTADEAQYAIDNLEANYNENALKKAKSYQEMDMSPGAIKDQLSSPYGEKFTTVEAQYAFDNLDK